MLKKLTLIFSMLVLAIMLCSSVSAVDTTVQVNLNATCGQPNAGSLNPAISADGNYVTYSSDASNLVADDTNGKSDIFVYSRITNQTQRVSVTSSGVQSNGNSYNPSISADGRYVVFDSTADNLVPLDTNRCSDIFIYDRILNYITRIGLNSTLTQLYGNSYNPSISGDGNYVVFEFYDTTISGSYGTSTIYLYNKTAGNCTSISSGTNPMINIDGTCVVYQTSQHVLVGPGLPSGTGTGYLPGIGTVSGDSKIQLYYLNGTSITVSVDPYGYEANGPSYNPSINKDGTMITFQSNANNLCPGDTAGNTDIFVRDLRDPIHPTTIRVSVSSSNQQANGASVNPSISGNGQYITYCSFANNLVEGDTNGVADIFFYNMSSGKTLRISVDSNDDQFSFGSYLPSTCTDGHYAVFLSKPSIDNGYEKVLLHDCTWNVNTNLSSGAYYTPQNLVFTANQGVNIFYTTDGTDPTTGSTPYTTPINISATQTLKYIAVDAAGNQSPVNTRIYQIYAWEPYSYHVTVAYRLSNKKYRIKYYVPYLAKKRIRTKVGNKWKYSYIYVTKYKAKYRWDYRYGYRTETRWAYHWVLKY